MILIVDDDCRMCHSLKALLSTEGYEVRLEHNGGDALKHLGEGDIDLVLLDIVMEKMNGFQVMEKMAERHLGTPVIIITGFASTASAVEALRRGAYDYLRKPFEPEKLIASVKNALTQRRLRNEKDRVIRTLKESEEHFKNLFNQTIDCIFIVDPMHENGPTIVDANEAACLTYGYAAGDFSGKPFSSIEAPNEGARGISMIQKLKPGEQLLYEASHAHKDGMVIPVEASIRMATIGGRPILYAIMRNATERKRAAAEKEKLQRELFQAQKMEAIGRLAGGVAHDFNNMLSIILGRAELAKMKTKSSDAIYKDLCDIEAVSRRSANLTRQLLGFARKQAIAPRILNLNHTVESLLKMLRRLIGEHIELLWKPAFELWQVKMDPAQIDQILANLIINARDAIRDGGKVIIETDNVVLDEAYCAFHKGFVPGEFALLSVSDDGCGIDRKTLSNIFEPFFTTKDVGKGTGLGLATVYGITKQNQGFINAYSEPGRGSTFKIYLPRYGGNGSVRVAETSEEPITGGSETVLVVEDEPEILGVVTSMLESLGYRVVGVGSPSKAIRIAVEYPGEIHLLITDVVMPEMNGRDLSERLLSFYPDLKCLFMSGYTANVIAHHGVLDEGVRFIQKPFSMKELAGTIRRVLSGKRG